MMVVVVVTFVLQRVRRSLVKPIGLILGLSICSGAERGFLRHPQGGSVFGRILPLQDDIML